MRVWAAVFVAGRLRWLLSVDDVGAVEASRRPANGRPSHYALTNTIPDQELSNVRSESLQQNALSSLQTTRYTNSSCGPQLATHNLLHATRIQHEHGSSKQVFRRTGNEVVPSR